MKVGTITFFNSENYGAVLQAYALSRKIREMGHECEIINYCNKDHGVAHRYGIFENSGNIKGTIRDVLSLPRYYELKRKREKFKQFMRDYFLLSKETYRSNEDLRKNPPGYDAYVCGSDQIWKAEKGQYIHTPYFLEFAQYFTARTISYAPSFGKTSVPSHLRGEIVQLLSKIMYLSVREMQGKRIIRELADRDAEVVLDPTLLLQAAEWDVLKKTPKMEGKYILVYSLQRNALLTDLINRVKKVTKLPVVVISATGVNFVRPADRVIYDADPGDFIGLIRKAACVCTNSFHGTAFSIIHRKPFFTVPHSTSNSRISSLLDILELSHRQIKNTADISGDPLSIDYTIAEGLLEAEREKSLRFLRMALDG